MEGFRDAAFVYAAEVVLDGGLVGGVVAEGEEKEKEEENKDGRVAGARATLIWILELFLLDRAPATVTTTSPTKWLCCMHAAGFLVPWKWTQTTLFRDREWGVEVTRNRIFAPNLLCANGVS
nr:hypothetical protein CFP56_24224 [Quercus suber]